MRLISIICICFISFCAFSQSQISTLPLQYNPGFAGSTEKGRVAFFSGVDTSRKNFQKRTNYSGQISYDKFFPELSAGFGIQAGTVSAENESRVAEDFLAGYNIDYIPGYYYSSRITYQVKFSGAFKLSWKGKYTFSPGLSIAYSSVQSSLQTSNIYLAPDITSKMSSIVYTIGGVLNTDRYYAGISTELGEKYFSDRKKFFSGKKMLFLQAGYVFQAKPNANFSFSPAGIVKTKFYSTGKIEIPQIILNLNFRYKKVLFGIMPGIMAGYQNKKLKAQMAFGKWYLHKKKFLFANSENTIELSFTYKFLTKGR